MLNLNDIKEKVEGNGSETALTLEGELTEEEILEAFKQAYIKLGVDNETKLQQMSEDIDRRFEAV